MKKYIPTILCISIGLFFGFLIINEYKKDDITDVSYQKNILYFLQIGAYSSYEEMTENVNDFYNYIYEEKDGLYYTYICLLKNEEILNKLKEFLEKEGYVIYVKEKYLNNPGFFEVLDQYELLLRETNDKDAIMTICSQIVSKYEELELND